MTTHISIIGAGFCGTALARELAREHAARIRVSLIGVAQTFGRGVAYGEARREHLMNVRARDMGIDADQAAGFADFLRLDPRGRVGFLPRLAYGDYLCSQLEQAINAASIEIRRVPEQAVAVERSSGGRFRIFLGNGDDIVSDVVILAVGALAPQALPGIGPHLSVSPRYIGWPWHGASLDSIDPHARILVVGTGLTMVDVAVTLHGRGHCGRITAISRRGVAPQSHLPQPGPALELPATVLRALRAHDLTRLLGRMRTLALQVDDWRRAVDALRPFLQPFWQGLAPAARGRFLRHLRPYWEAARHRVAPEVYQCLEIMHASGQLQIRAARLLRAGLRGDQLEAVIRDRHCHQARREHYDVLIRATGLDTDVDRTSDPLICSMREAGLIRADPLGLGLQVSDDYRVLDASARPVPGLYCIGPLLRGALWEITAVPELRVVARELAAGLLLRPAQRLAQLAQLRQTAE